VQLESGSGNQAALHAARRTDEQDFGAMPGDQFARHGQRGNDVAAGAAAGYDDAELRQIVCLSNGNEGGKPWEQIGSIKTCLPEPMILRNRGGRRRLENAVAGPLDENGLKSAR